MTLTVDSGSSAGPMAQGLEAWFGRVKQLLADGGLVSFTPKGYSMWPTLRPASDLVYLRAAADYRRGDIVLAQCQGAQSGVVLHRVKAIADGRATLMGDSNLWQTEVCDVGDIVGKVVSIERRGCDVTDSMATRLASTVQRLPDPLRCLVVRAANYRRTHK